MTDLLLGVWAVLGEPRTAALLEGAGFDWVLLDAQHGHFDDAAVRDTLALRRGRRAPVLVRPLRNDAALIGRALDDGADGVIVPLVESAAEAEAAVAAAAYPPRGFRSFGPLPFLERTEAAQRAKPFVGVMVETAAGLADVAAIAATPGLDLVFVGPNDLSLSLGTTIDALLDDGRDGPLGRIVDACLAAGVTPGAFGPTPERVARFARHGFTFLVTALDTDVVAAGGAIADRARAASR